MLIYGGVFERHAKLRIVCVEAEHSLREGREVSLRF